MSKPMTISDERIAELAGLAEMVKPEIELCDVIHFTYGELATLLQLARVRRCEAAELDVAIAWMKKADEIGAIDHSRTATLTAEKLEWDLASAATDAARREMEGR